MGIKTGRGVTGWLIRRRVGEPAVLSADQRSHLGELAGQVSVTLSVLLALIKGVLGFLSGSIALIADAVNSLADIAGSVVVIVGFRMARKPRDEEHPYGHGRMESVAGLVLSILLIVVGIECARAGFQRLRSPAPVSVQGWVLAAVGGAILIKIWMAWFARRLAAITQSTALAAEAWNHGFDIISSLLVVVGMAGARIGYPAMDGWAGLGVAAFIMHTGLRYARETVNTLLGEAPHPEEIRGIKREALAVEGVRGAHDVVVHDYGGKKLITLHVEVDAALPAIEVHRIAEEVERRVAARTSARALVHSDPVDREHPDYLRVSAALERCIVASEHLTAYHDLRLQGKPPRLIVAVDLVTDNRVGTEEFEGLLDRMAREIGGQIPGMIELDVGLETRYASDPEYRKVYAI